jgi:hypothetical protein
MNTFINEIDISAFKPSKIAKENVDERLSNGLNSSFTFLEVSQFIEETKAPFAKLLESCYKKVEL